MWKSEGTLQELVLSSTMLVLRTELRSPGFVASVFPYFLAMFILESLFLTDPQRFAGLWALEWTHCSLTSKNYPRPAYTHKEIPNTLALSFST